MDYLNKLRSKISLSEFDLEPIGNIISTLEGIVNSYYLQYSIGLLEKSYLKDRKMAATKLRVTLARSRPIISFFNNEGANPVAAIHDVRVTDADIKAFTDQMMNTYVSAGNWAFQIFEIERWIDKLTHHLGSANTVFEFKPKSVDNLLLGLDNLEKFCQSLYGEKPVLYVFYPRTNKSQRESLERVKEKLADIRELLNDFRPIKARVGSDMQMDHRQILN